MHAETWLSHLEWKALSAIQILIHIFRTSIWAKAEFFTDAFIVTR